MTRLRRRFTAVASFVAAWAGGAGLTACAGAPAFAPPSSIAARPAPAASTTLRIVIPPKTALPAAAGRMPRYVSPATQSIAIAFAASGGVTSTYNQNLTPASNPNCKASLISPTVCTVTLNVAPGSYTAQFATYDGLLDGNGNPTGNRLSANQNFPVTVAAGQANAINVTLQGVPSTLAFLPGVTSGLRGSASSGYTLSTCAPGSHAVTILGVDADGNYILGPGAPQPALTATSGGGAVAIGAPGANTPNTFTITTQSGVNAGQAVALKATVRPSAATPNDSGAYAISNSVQLRYDANLCGAIAEFSIPTANAAPQGLTPGPDGALWFTELTGNAIGTVTPAGAVTEYPLQYSNARPEGMAVGPSDSQMVAGGALWFTTNYGLGLIAPTGAPQPYTYNYMFTSTAQPLSITASADGNLWFTEAFTNTIGEYDVASRGLREYTLPAGAQPRFITAGPDGALWFTDPNRNKIGRITTAGSSTDFTIPTPNSAPEAIAAGPDGALWFTQTGSNQIGRITTAGAITEFTIPTANASPGGITPGPDGALWFVEFAANKIGRVATSGDFTEFALPTPGAFSPGVRVRQEIAAGADGAVWFLESGLNKIGRLR